jgi:hypothetical protein
VGLISQKVRTLDGNSYTDLAAKAAGCAAVRGNLVQAIINCNYCFLYFLWCYELLKSKKKSGCCCGSSWTYAKELLTQIRDVKKVISTTLYILIYPEYISD